MTDRQHYLASYYRLCFYSSSPSSSLSRSNHRWSRISSLNKTNTIYKKMRIFPLRSHSDLHSSATIVIKRYSRYQHRDRSLPIETLRVKSRHRKGKRINITIEACGDNGRGRAGILDGCVGEGELVGGAGVEGYGLADVGSGAHLGDEFAGGRWVSLSCCSNG